MRNLILVSTNIILQKREKSTRNCLPMSVIAILSIGLTSVKEKTLCGMVLSKDRKTLQGEIQGDNVVDIVHICVALKISL